MVGRLTRRSRRAAAVLAAVLLAGAGGPEGHAAGPWRADASNTEGWHDMSPAERVEHQRRIRSVGSFEECAAYESARRRRVRERAGRNARLAAPAQAERSVSSLSPASSASPAEVARSAPAASVERPAAPAQTERPASSPAGDDLCRQLQAQGRWR